MRERSLFTLEQMIRNLTKFQFLLLYGLTFMEIFPIGLIVTLSSALVLKRKGEELVSAV